MIYLIGVDPVVQHINKEASAEKAKLVAEFTHHLKEAAKSLRVVLLAEEFSTEALAKSSTTSSTAQKVSRELKIQHRFCDPNLQERHSLCIGKDNFHRRELYWLDCIRDKRNEDIIFICGNDHLESFTSLLRRKGFQSRVHSKDWGLGFTYSPF
ncbi:MAG: hypothetical protein AAB277_01105 [Planctomycetota bacterium]